MLLDYSGDIIQNSIALSEIRHGVFVIICVSTTVRSDIIYNYSIYNVYICRKDYKHICHKQSDFYKNVYIQTGKNEVRSDCYGLWITQKN